jgi:hypothetical protein
MEEMFLGDNLLELLLQKPIELYQPKRYRKYDGIERCLLQLSICGANVIVITTKKGSLEHHNYHTVALCSLVKCQEILT